MVPSTTTAEMNSKKKFVFRVVTAQGSEFLFQTNDAPSLERWVGAIQGLNAGLAVANESFNTLQRPESSNRLAPNSPARPSSPQPPKQGRKKGVCVCVCCLLYTSPSPRDATLSRMPSSA